MFNKLQLAFIAKTLMANTDMICKLRIFGWLLDDASREGVYKFADAAASENLEKTALAKMAAPPKAKPVAGRKKSVLTGRAQVLSMLGL
jgi:hypothetical protein